MVLPSNDPQSPLPSFPLEAVQSSSQQQRVYRRLAINQIRNVHNKIIQNTSYNAHVIFNTDYLYLLRWLLLAISLILVFAYSTEQYPFGERNIIVEKYNQLVYNCDRKFEVSEIISKIRRDNYLHQIDALEQFQDALDSHKRYNAIAFVGPPGVGKTLLANQFGKYFPWQNSVYKYNWQTKVGDEVSKMHVLRMMVNDVYDCGISLLIIDNLEPCEHGLIAAIESLSYDVIGVNRFNDLKARLIVIFIFSLNVIDGEQTFWAQHKLLQDLTNTITLNFEKFGLRELKDCIWREVEYGNMTITMDKFYEIINEINIETSGCKNVRVKVLTYGDPK